MDSAKRYLASEEVFSAEIYVKNLTVVPVLKF